jgi:hypothetical protein
MDAKRISVSVLVGGAVLYATGYLIFDVLFSEFYTANAGSAAGVPRESQIVWSVALSSLAYAGLIVFAMGNRGAAVTVGRGAIVGAIVGFLFWFSVDFYFYGATNLATLTRTVVDPILEFVHGGIGGAAIAGALRMLPASASGTQRAAG